MQLKRSILPPRPDWNQMGPPVPLWFRRQVEMIDKDWTLQFVPPRSQDPEGVPDDIYPEGVWDICYKLPRSGYLRPVAVYSLADEDGYFSMPTPKIIEMLRLAKALIIQGQGHRLNEMMDEAILDYNDAKYRDSKDRQMNAMSRYLSIHGHRQFQNRVYLRNDGQRKRETVS